MAFFSEVKAKLGLDITPFERGLKNAQTAAGGLGKGIGKQFAGTEKMAGALAAAIGLNMQDISKGIARMVVGFSKEQEESLDNLVSKTEEAARKQEAALAGAQRKQESLREQVAKKEEERRVSRLTDQTRENELIAERDRLNVVAAGKGTKALEAKMRLFEIEEELVKILDRKIAKEVAANDAANKAAADAAAERKEQADWIDGILEATEKDLADAEKKRLDTLKAQSKELKDQRDTIKQSLADYASTQRQNVKATTDEVRSGKRNIGSRARREVGALDKSQARLRFLEDAGQRKQEEIDAAKTEGDKRRLTGERTKIIAEQNAEFGRSEKLKGGLESRVSDIDTNAKQLTELELIKKAVTSMDSALKRQTL